MTTTSEGRRRFMVGGPLILGVGIEDTFVPQSKAGFRPLDEYELTGHYDHWEADLEFAASTGARWIRYGIPWYRVHTALERYEFDWADRAIDKILTLGMELIVDVVHYGTPTWLEGEFSHPDYPQVAAEYAGRLAQRYGDRVTMWSPVNEPYATALQCGMRGVWPPYLSGEEGFMRVLAPVMQGAVLAQLAIAAASPREAVFVHAEAALNYEAGDEAVKPEVDYLERRRFLALDLLAGRVDPGSTFAEEIVARGFDGAALDWFVEHAVEIDLLGVNYYPTFGTLNLTLENGAVLETPRDRWTSGFERVLRDYHEHFGVPLYISETSLDGSLADRLRWMHDSVELAERLRAEGLPLLGYTWWPILDMIDWEYRHTELPVTDYIATMGLADLVPDGHGGFSRRPNALLDAFRRIAGGK